MKRYVYGLLSTNGDLIREGKTLWRTYDAALQSGQRVTGLRNNSIPNPYTVTVREINISTQNIIRDREMRQNRLLFEAIMDTLYLDELQIQVIKLCPLTSLWLAEVMFF